MISHTVQKYTLPHIIFKDYKNIHPSYLPTPQDIRQIITTIKVQANPKITWNQKTNSTLKKWLHSCIPTLKNNHVKLLQTHSIGDLFAICNKLKFHRQQIFNLAHTALDNEVKMKRVSLFQLQKIYQTFVNLKHDNNLDFADKLRKVLVAKITQFQRLDQKKILPYLNFIQNIILDRHIAVSKKNQLIRQMSKRIKNETQFLQNLRKGVPERLILSRIYELSKLFNIQLSLQIMQIVKDVNQTIQTVFKQQRDKNMSNYIIQWNDKAYFNSVFQKIFEKKLTAMGYNFENNIFIKGNEYDVLVKGKNKKKYCPLSSLNISQPNSNNNNQPISLQKIKKIASSRQLQTIQDKVELKESVVLDLNGPIHYIDSDTNNKNCISRMEQIKYERLALFGIYKYNLVNFVEWEQANKYEKVSQEFVNNKINNPITLQAPC